MTIVALQQVQLFVQNSVEDQTGAQLCLRSLTHFTGIAVNKKNTERKNGFGRITEPAPKKIQT